MPRWTDKNRNPLGKLRSGAGLSQAEVSVKLGIGIHSVVRYESGISDLTIRLAEQMSALYGVPFEEIRKAVAETERPKSKHKNRILNKSDREEEPA
ncbi:MAG: helix-turn-helix domain-containing protein [Synergistaceae bacterium]|nr:helix-turn-helix domain-containing protein [Synergistaceae bacterium]